MFDYIKFWMAKEVAHLLTVLLILAIPASLFGLILLNDAYQNWKRKRSATPEGK